MKREGCGSFLTEEREAPVVKGRVKREVQIERVHFRLIQLPCCEHLYCRVNPRLPNFCPECGERVFALLKQDPTKILVSDIDAELRYHLV